MLSDTLVREYRKNRAPRFQTFEAHAPTIFVSPASYALRNAREAIEERQLTRSGFLAIVNEYDPDSDSEDASIRLRIESDDDPEFCLDFDCCTTREFGGITGRASRRYMVATGERWIKCQDAYESAERHGADVYGPTENSIYCEYRQPCRHKCEQARRLEHEGACGIVAEYRDPESDEWTDAESCYGFIGDDWRESGCVPDLLGAARDALRARYHAIATAARTVRAQLATSAALVDAYTV